MLCAAELASAARRRGRDTDPRVTNAISMVQMWAGSKADALDLLAAECDALDAARESAQAADHEAELALTLFGAAPRRRPSWSGMNRALGAWQRWREVERDRWLALAAASAAAATTLPGDATLTEAEWADCVSKSATYALQAMTTQRPSGGHPGWAAKRRCARLAKRRLTCLQQAQNGVGFGPPAGRVRLECGAPAGRGGPGFEPSARRDRPGFGARAEAVRMVPRGGGLSLQQAEAVPDSVPQHAQAVSDSVPQQAEEVSDSAMAAPMISVAADSSSWWRRKRMTATSEGAGEGNVPSASKHELVE